MNIRTTNTLSDVTYVTKSQVKSIITLDFQRGDTFATLKDAMTNFETYFLGINLWTNMGVDLDQKALTEYFHGHMLRYGLIETIKVATTEAENLRSKGIHGSEFMNHYWTNRHYKNDIAEYRDMLQFLDFLKRFSVENAELLEKRSVSDLIDFDHKFRFRLKPEAILRPGHPLVEINTFPKYIDPLFETYYERNSIGYTVHINPQRLRVGSTNHWAPHVAYYCNALFPNTLTVEWYGTTHRHGSGAVADSCTCKACKRLHDPAIYAGVAVEGTEPLNSYSVIPFGVPKSYKVYRVICKLPTANQSAGYQLVDQLIHWTETNTVNVGPYQYRQSDIIVLRPDNGTDEVNGTIQYRNPSHRALLDPRATTIDMERASDTITKLHIKALLPKGTADALLANAPTHWFYNGKTIPMNMFNPMGGVTTFPVENRVFAAIVLAAYDIYYTFNPNSEELLVPKVFGDDIIVDKRVYTLVLELLENFGFVPNVTKSFGDENHMYREACGRHFFNGTEVTCLYFPRHPMNSDANTAYDSFREQWDSRASSLLELNNHMFSIHEDRALKYGWTIAFMQLYIKEMYADATFLDPNDPWTTDNCLHGIEVKYPTVDILTGEKKDMFANEIRCRMSDPTRAGIRVLGTVVGTAEWKRRVRKVVSTDKPCLHTQLDISLEEFVENLVYEDYLREGPDYNDDRDRALGVSQRRNRGMYTQTPILTFKVRRF